ncbi:Tim44 domain-containing protein [Acuticoccus mangrovi]|uniref:Tim44 domain-containing protein n=1 Tax=Acuticoccus mangrovi TaxID=2796142 RepID=A0A934IIT1_9HYPH|nr:Tim44 domain-containing protein [Acuticoccus mangrovi]MBJ3777469.1 Tim44 domain-containing protein [Acuticoccus mangrovi]
MPSRHRLRALLALAVLATSFTLVTADFAEARRGGSFGSRGYRTYSAPAPTRTSPSTAAPINRSMTPRQTTGSPNAAGATTARQTRRGGLFGGLAGGLLGGLMLGGLVGMLMGHGLGGMAGFFGLLLQIGLVILVVSFVMRMFRGRREPAFAGGRMDAPHQSPYAGFGNGGTGPTRTAGGTQSPSGLSGHPGADVADIDAEPLTATGADEIGITADDLDAFEQLLAEIQAAYAREDFAGLRARCTPEIVSFFSEELSENAINGVRNDVTDVHLLQGDLAEAWREDDEEYATVAMRYSSVDVMRNRNTGEIVEGDPAPTETMEVWTFVRPVGGAWKLSAVQE